MENDFYLKNITIYVAKGYSHDNNLHLCSEIIISLKGYIFDHLLRIINTQNNLRLNWRILALLHY